MNKEYTKIKLNTIALNHNLMNLIPINKYISIELTESSSTGYCWHNSISNPSIIALEDKRIFDFNKPNILGGSLQIIWIFKCLQLGECKIHFSYYNSWKNDSFALDEQIYMIKVE